MRTNLSVFAVIVLCGVALCEAEDFNISSLSHREKEGYCFIYVKYQAKVGENLQLKVYALLDSKKEQSLAKASLGVRIEKGYTKEILYISPQDLESKGKPKKLRAEIWSEVGGESVLVYSKTKPKWHEGREKWWELDISQCAIKKGGKDILDLIKKMED